MAPKPTRSKPAPKSASAETEETQAAAPKTRAKRTVASKLDVYYEDENGALTPLGDFKGAKPEEALQTYFDALPDADEQANALALVNYAVNTPRGLVKLALAQKLEIVKR